MNDSKGRHGMQTHTQYIFYRICKFDKRWHRITAWVTEAILTCGRAVHVDDVTIIRIDVAPELSRSARASGSLFDGAVDAAMSTASPD